MVALAVLLTVILCATADVVVRLALTRIRENRKKREWAEALDTGLRLTFAEDTKTLKRVTVAEPRARILAVDDEEVILDVFRKFLVLAGYSVDTVQSGPEALTLIQKNDYEFVFTDLKMPEMEGEAVVKAVKHLRPDIDVVVITGYGTIESAVETMKFGAMDYIQKPFTEDELVQMVHKFVIRRQDRLERQAKPRVHLVTPSIKQSKSPYQINVLSGIFIAPGHTWLSIEPNGTVCIGLDDFAQRFLGVISGVDLPAPDQIVSKGTRLFSLRQGARVVHIPSPVSGQVRAVNTALAHAPKAVNTKPYEAGWVCRIEAENLPADMGTLKMGANALNWYQEELDRAKKELAETPCLPHTDPAPLSDENWKVFCERFLLSK